MSNIKGIKFIVWMYTKRLIRECLKAIWAFLNKNRGTLKEKDLKENASKFLKDYKRKKLLLTVALVMIDCYIVFTALDYNVKEVLIVERIGDVVSSPLMVGEETVAYDSQDAEEVSSSSATTEWDKTVEVSAYTSRVSETDASPCISADNSNICEYDGCAIATNDYPLGSVIELEGFGKCTVKDRMAKRYTGSGNIDVYMGMDLDKALEFGRKQLNIKLET